MVDACRDDPDQARGARGGITADSVRPPQGVAALFSCRAGERAFENDKLRHGVFFYQVLQGLKGEAKDRKGRVTFAGLSAYVTQEVQEQVPRLVGGGARQTPAMEARYAGEPVLLAAREAPSARGPAPGQVEGPPSPLDCTGPDGASRGEVLMAQRAWAKHLGRPVEETVRVDGVPFRFVLIPPGQFLMGSPADEANRHKDEVRHEVTLTKPFGLMTTELTQRQYRAITGTNPSNFEGDDLPVGMVSWTEADGFADKLTGRLADGHVYRLPTEAEWEYACRGGHPSSKPFGIGGGASLSSRQANFEGGHPHEAARGPFLNRPAPVASYRGSANGFGLFDMHGNVREWCADWYADYPTAAVTDPTGPPSGSERVSRGGCWMSDALHCRSAGRNRGGPGDRSDETGFRLARVPSGAR
jgi:formylglycine-generating enzyme required for sulfatase activity